MNKGFAFAARIFGRFCYWCCRLPIFRRLGHWLFPGQDWEELQPPFPNFIRDNRLDRQPLGPMGYVRRMAVAADHPDVPLYAIMEMDHLGFQVLYRTHQLRILRELLPNLSEGDLRRFLQDNDEMFMDEDYNN